jgi:hypothetical protein
LDSLFEKIKGSLDEESLEEDKNVKIENTFNELGKKLFDCLCCNDDIAGQFKDDYCYNCPDVSNRRIVLEIDHPDFQSLPWELLHDGSRYLGFADNLSIIRKPSTFGDIPVKSLSGTLKILIILSTPKVEKLPYAKSEKDAIIETVNSKLKDKAEIHVISTDFSDEQKLVLFDNEENHSKVIERGKSTLDNISTLLKHTQYNIIHYIGHSYFDTEYKIGRIVLSKKDQTEDPIPDKFFANLFTDETTKSLALIVFDSCESGTVYDNKGLSMEIVGSKLIPCVVSMQFRIADRMGKPFAQKFYEELIPNYDPEKAILKAREKILIGRRRYLEFVAPVVYLLSDGDKILLTEENMQDRLRTRSEEGKDTSIEIKSTRTEQGIDSRIIKFSDRDRHTYYSELKMNALITLEHLDLIEKGFGDKLNLNDRKKELRNSFFNKFQKWLSDYKTWDPPMESKNVSIKNICKLTEDLLRDAFDIKPGKIKKQFEESCDMIRTNINTLRTVSEDALRNINTLRVVSGSTRRLE